jgi:Transmembrane secretion effector
MLRRRGGLLRQHDFRHLWVADALSQFGSRISLLAVPLLALTALGATPFQVARLTVCERAGILLLSLPVGAWADRLRCRPLLVGADLGRFVLLGSIPVAAAFDLLSLSSCTSCWCSWASTRRCSMWLTRRTFLGSLPRMT